MFISVTKTRDVDDRDVDEFPTLTADSSVYYCTRRVPVEREIINVYDVFEI